MQQVVLACIEVVLVLARIESTIARSQNLNKQNINYKNKKGYGFHKGTSFFDYSNCNRNKTDRIVNLLTISE